MKIPKSEPIQSAIHCPKRKRCGIITKICEKDKPTVCGRDLSRPYYLIYKRFNK